MMATIGCSMAQNSLLGSREFKCDYCGETIEVPKYVDSWEHKERHVTYHCPEVGLVGGDN